MITTDWKEVVLLTKQLHCTLCTFTSVDLHTLSLIFQITSAVIATLVSEWKRKQEISAEKKKKKKIN